MQSDAAPSPTTQVQHLNQLSQHDLKLKVDVSKKPIDFIRENLSVPDAQIVTPDTIIKTVKDAVAPEKPAPQAAPPADPQPTFGFDAPPSTPPKPSEAPIADGAGIDDGEPVDPGEENFKRLRQARAAADRARKEAEAKYTEAVQELEKYKTGEVVPEILQQKENEIARLSVYEKLHNLKKLPAYQEKVTKPLNDNLDKLKSYFTDYGKSPEETEESINYALQLNNKAELNRFLGETFDPIGAEEVKRIINEIRQLQSEGRSMEMEPVEAIQALEREHQQIQAAKEVQRKSRIADTAKDSWVKSLFKIREHNTMPELIYKDNDPEHNKKFVTPIVTQASTEYGKIVTMLAEAGLSDLKPELAEALSNMTLLAHASAVAAQTRNLALEHAQELEDGSRRGNMLFRPPVGGGVPSSAAPESSKPRTLEQDANALINTVLQKRRA